MEEASASLPHVVVFPFPAQGHINPGLQFAQLLASSLSLCRVTFVNTSYNIAKLRAAHLDLGPSLRLRALADDGQHGLDHDFFARVELMGGLLEALLLELQHQKIHGHSSAGDRICRCECSKGSHQAVEEEKAVETDNDIQKSHGGNCTHTNDCRRRLHEADDRDGELADDRDGDWPPPVCIISDTFLGWVQDIADKFNIPRFILYTPSPATLVLMLSLPEMLRQGRLPCHSALVEAHMQPLNLPGLGQTLCLTDVPSHLLLPPSAFMFNYFIRHSKRIPEAAAILLNSFYKLQSSAIDAARDLVGPLPSMWADLLHEHLQHKVITVGPLLPIHMFDGSKNSKGVALRTSGLDDDTCLQWLEHHPPSSVIYVSFGSMADLAEEQIRELAWGLEASGKPYLWVIRGESAQYLPQDLRMDMELSLANMGPLEASLSHSSTSTHTQATKRLVVSWAPQLDVLSHPSTGFFLSHCGWNSTLEAVCAGVPVLGWPLFAEQKMNCRFLVDELQIAMEFSNQGGLVDKDEVERVVRKALETEQGQLLRSCASAWKGLAREAVLDGGLSQENVKAFGSFLSSLHGVRAKT